MQHTSKTRHELHNASPGDILLFYRAQGLSRIITFLSGSRYHHVGIYAGEYLVIESRITGVLKRDLRDAKIRLRFRVIPAPGGPQVGRVALTWAEKQIGERYAYLSIAGLFFDRLFDRFIGPVDIVWRQRDRISCGELVAQAYEVAGEQLFPDSEAVAPWDFARLLRRHTRK